MKMILRITSKTLKNVHLYDGKNLCRYFTSMLANKGYLTAAPDKYLQHATNKLFFCHKASTKYKSECEEEKEFHFTGTHVPVMVEEVLKLVNPKPKQVILDMTFGGGGHSKMLLKREQDIKILALDRDPDAFKHAEDVSKIEPNIQPILGKFSEVDRHLASLGYGINSIDAVLFDVGSSSMQFDISERGFSISKDGPLDMRMDKDRYPDSPTAADVVNFLDEPGLYKVLKIYGEEKKAKYIARAIVESRHAYGNITSTKQLAAVVESAFSEGAHRRDKLMRHSHVATKTFQALRTFVNNELNELHNGLEIAHQLLKPGGICVAIAFHSLEDRIIKRLFHGINVDDKINKTLKDHQKNNIVTYSDEDVRQLLEKKWNPVYRKPLLPSDEEVERNKRARSAKLRAAIKI